MDSRDQATPHKEPETVSRRVLLLVTDLEIGGTPTVVRELAVRLSRFAAFEVACLKPAGPVAEPIRAAGVPVTSFEARSVVQLPGLARRLARFVRDREIDAVFSFLVHANLAAALASVGLRGVRFLQSIQTTQPKPRWHWLAQALAAPAAERIVVPSSAVAETAVARCCIDRGRISMIPNAINPAEFAFEPRWELGSPVRVGFIGRLDPVKNLPALRDAVALVRRRCGDAVRLAIYGDGVERPTVERWAAREPWVEYVGPVPRPQAALGQIDMLVLPSEGEGFGLVLIEAMASAVPVLGVRAGGVTDVIGDGRDGLLIAPGNGIAPRLAEAIERLIADSELRKRLIDEGRRTVERRFTWETVLPHYRRLLEI